MQRNFPDKHLVQFIETIQPKGVAIDLGCGSGADAMYLASAGFDKVYAVDQSFDGLSDGAKECREIEFVCTDYEEFIDDKKFDFILSRCSAFTNEKIVKIFESLNDGGYLFVKTFQEKVDEDFLKDYFKDQIRKMKKYHVSEDHPPIGKHEHNVLFMIINKK